MSKRTEKRLAQTSATKILSSMEFLDKKPRHTLLPRVCPLRILLNFVAVLV